MTSGTMETRVVTGTDLVTSRAVLGTMTFGAQLDAAESARAVDIARAAGVTHFDCANSYTDGVAEEVLGAALGRSRSEVIVATKAFNPVRGVSGLGRKALTDALDASLGRLGTDYVDILYLHMPDWQTPIEETIEALDSLVQQGKVRYPAMSNYASWQIAEARALQQVRGFAPVHIAQQMYNLITRGLDDEYAAFAEAYDMTTLIYNPLAGGLLTGKYSSVDDAAAPGTRFTGQPYRDRYWSERQFAAAAQVAAIAADAGLTPIDVSLGWALGRPLVDGIILGGSSVDQLETNLAAFARGPLGEDLMERCDAVWQELRGPIPRYNR
ncbi:aldo/keto reductase [Planctomonas psychrotolerans]|uniref:aldo/keto reductase n=1 Tax=Planctomonas psychrotolerans TaxID=2528712 RepID=UPI00123C3309|nr:aldo/keto reductase [Planctomonas psychrotolerans]